MIWVTKLTPAECVSRLSATVDRDVRSGSREVIGTVTESSIRIRKRLGYRNSFQTLLVARMRYDERERLTSIVGTTGTNPWIRAFTSLWFATLAAMSVAVVGTSSAAPARIGIPAVAALGLVVMWIGRYSA